MAGGPRPARSDRRGARRARAIRRDREPAVASRRTVVGRSPRPAGPADQSRPADRVAAARPAAAAAAPHRRRRRSGVIAAVVHRRRRARDCRRGGARCSADHSGWWHRARADGLRPRRVGPHLGSAASGAHGCAPLAERPSKQHHIAQRWIAPRVRFADRHGADGGARSSRRPRRSGIVVPASGAASRRQPGPERLRLGAWID